jgi:hypothetical protein
MEEKDRRIRESPLRQGVDEEIVYHLTTTPWGGTPSSPAVKLYDSAGADVSSTYLVGSASVSGDIVNTPTVKNFTVALNLQLEIKFTTGGDILEAWSALIVEA